VASLLALGWRAVTRSRQPRPLTTWQADRHVAREHSTPPPPLLRRSSYAGDAGRARPRRVPRGAPERERAPVHARRSPLCTACSVGTRAKDLQVAYDRLRELRACRRRSRRDHQRLQPSWPARRLPRCGAELPPAAGAWSTSQREASRRPHLLRGRSQRAARRVVRGRGDHARLRRYSWERLWSAAATPLPARSRHRPSPAG
jgi:hypothetical protein